jgi:hypothetical protein
MNPLPPDIEPQILPLVEALNQTGVVQTFSSCAGHFGPDEQHLRDRNHAEVRFIPAPGITTEQVESALAFWLIRFKQQHGIFPVQTIGYKLFTAVDDAVEVSFVLELRPFNRFDPPATKRNDIDRAIGQILNVLE